MKNAVILHGMPGKKDYYNPHGDSQSNCHWLPWLQQQLIVNNILAQTPEMPEPYNPEYEGWKSEFERHNINEETTLVGHSCGGGFIVRYLSENPDVRVNRVVLVAPWIDMEHKLQTGMFNFEMDRNLAIRTNGLHIFSSDNDEAIIKENIDKLLTELVGVRHHQFSGFGHFTFKGMGTKEFPELLRCVVGTK